MPNKEAHLAAALENQKVIDFLCNKIDDHPGWVVTVAFYKALHVVEAMFAEGPSMPGHTDDHKTRNAILKDKRFSHIWKNYRPLWTASLIARYLRENTNSPTYDIFSSYMPPAIVKNLVLGHYLKQVEKSAGNLMGDPNLSEKIN